MGRRTDWQALTERTLAELKICDERFRPTSFWGPGLTQLLNDLNQQGLSSFKSWASSGYWFYPRYGVGFTNATIDATLQRVAEVRPNANQNWVRAALNATHEARRDFDVARVAWDQERWPTDLDGFGESMTGKPIQYYRFTGGPHGWTRPYLNYTLCLAALSRHVETPPKRFLEIGGGYGVLGEFLLQRDRDAIYVDLDIPPLMTVASWYLTELFGNRVSIYDSVSENGSIDVTTSMALPNYRLPDLAGNFDVFVNSFSFQEMEPDVVRSYVDLVVARGIRHAVSLNSRLGKPKVSDGNAIGVIDPVTSSSIVRMFEERGFRLVGSYDGPLINSAAQLVVLERS
jgi:putative sugar O-methyltransferase